MWCNKIISLSLLVNHVCALNILVLVPVPLRSHYMAFKPLFRELATRGHSVTVINNYPDDEPLSNLRFVDLNSSLQMNVTDLASAEDLNTDFLHIKNYFRHITNNANRVKDICDSLFLNDNTVAHLAEGNKYDVIFVEQFLDDCGLLYAATQFDAPVIGITSHVLLPWSYRRLGIPFNPAADAFYFSISGANPSLYGRVEATLGHVIFNTIFNRYRQSLLYESFKKHRPDLSFDFETLVMERMKMMFSYQHHSITGARLLAPQLLEIAGAHIVTPKAVPKDIEDFLSTAEHGAIYVSFGSNLKMATSSPHKIEQFLGAFSRLPQKVLWKWENDTFPAGHDHILPMKWFPQLDILCHPKVVGFISHGGMLSMSEAAYCATPIIAVPFFGDQFSNAAAVRSSGLGKLMYFQHITEESLHEALQELTSQEMQQSAKKVSREFHDRPMSAVDSAIYWTEYVARHRAAPPALPSTRNAWFEYLLLDVACVLLTIVAITIWMCSLIVKLIRFSFKKVFGKVCRQERRNRKKKSH